MLLRLNHYLSLGCERQVIMCWKHKKRYICFIIKFTRPISFSDLSLHRIEINYEQMTIVWTYYEMKIIYFSSKFALGIPNVLSSFLPVFWSAILLLFPKDLNFFCCIRRKIYLNHWNSETNCLVLNLLLDNWGKYLQIFKRLCETCIN